jgi:hypothetical protein
MDGEITVESEVNKGTKFIIYVILAVKGVEDENSKRSTKLKAAGQNNMKMGIKNLNYSMAALQTSLLAKSGLVVQNP